ncbi:hypothetical protein C5167_037154 [Papaver somniferum]|uniref:Uncharacterized protein n=1 Tax=Papaver somniferum TaxID=3469 RepID=A0A4Y7I8P0_PAPSO|nr:hypothetical protein C5167_037154 [Papaver somniferum]
MRVKEFLMVFYLGKAKTRWSESGYRVSSNTRLKAFEFVDTGEF